MKKIHLLFYLLVVIDTLGQSPYGTQIGLTYYDLPSNASSPNRVVYNEDDQSVSVTWTQSITELAQPVSFDRGAGYNHFRPADGWVHGDEGACTNLNGCSQVRRAWPEIVNFPKESKLIDGVRYGEIKREVIIGHSEGLRMIARNWRSDSAWTEAEDLLIDQNFCYSWLNNAGFFPRIVSQGQNKIHMIAPIVRYWFQPGVVLECLPYTKLEEPLLYYRSSDQGQTWDIQNFVLPGLDDTTLFYNIRPDEYAIAANANVVAIVAGGIGQNWVMWKSEDYGETWNYTIIKHWNERTPEYPNYFSDSTNGKLTLDGAHSVTVDDDGNVHCFASYFISKLQNDGSIQNYDHQDKAGLWYWNDKVNNFCEPITIANLVDYIAPNGATRTIPLYSNEMNWNPLNGMDHNYDFSNYGLSAVSMPSASVDASGNLYVAYSAEVEGTVYENDATGPTNPTRDLYLVWSNDNGSTWSKEINIASEVAGFNDGSFGTEQEEDIFPMLPRKVGSDNMLHLVWNMDYIPGSHIIRDDGNVSQQYIQYFGIDISSGLPPFIPKTFLSMSSFVSDFEYSETQVQLGDTILITVDSGYIAFEPFESFIVDSVDFNFRNDSVYLVADSSSKLVRFINILNNACLDKDTSVVFNVIDGKLESIIEEDTLKICSGDSVELFGYGSGALSYSYKWNTGDSNQNIKVSPSTKTLYKLNVNNIVTDSVWVIVNPVPIVDAGADVYGVSDCNFSNSFQIGGDNDSLNQYFWYAIDGYFYEKVANRDQPKAFTSAGEGNIVVKATNNNGCIAYDTVYVKIDCIGSVEEKSNVDIQIFPNPTNNHVTISAGDKIKSYHLFDVFGKLIESKIENQKCFKIDVQTLSKGIYILQMNVNEEIISKKIDIF